MDKEQQAFVENMTKMEESERQPARDRVGCAVPAALSVLGDRRRVAVWVSRCSVPVPRQSLPVGGGDKQLICKPCPFENCAQQWQFEKVGNSIMKKRKDKANEPGGTGFYC